MTSPNSPLPRVAFSPGEFAALFGRSQTWGYRQIYAGKVKAVTEHGRILIPAAEVEEILKKAGIYDGLKRDPERPKRVQASKQKLQTAWRTFVEARREGVGAGQRAASLNKCGHGGGMSGRWQALNRLEKGGPSRR